MIDRRVCSLLLLSSLLAHPVLGAKPPEDGGVVERHRAWVAECLVTLDHLPGDARVLADTLTPADLAVLAAHPAMLQRAGAMSVSEQTILVGIIIVAIIVVIAVAGSGSATFFG